ncbi:MAG: zinc ribbon domain-containing protein [Phycisphaerae bacterium]
MPIYEYICQGCGKAFEALVSSANAKSACPSCGSRKIKRQFSTFAAHGGGAKTPCESGSCPSMAESDAGSCADGKCPFA